MQKYWKVIQVKESVHVMPCADLKKHVMSYDCHCKPKPPRDYDLKQYKLMMWLHNSYDKREEMEGN